MVIAWLFRVCELLLAALVGALLGHCTVSVIGDSEGQWWSWKVNTRINGRMRIRDAIELIRRERWRWAFGGVQKVLEVGGGRLSPWPGNDHWRHNAGSGALGVQSF